MLEFYSGPDDNWLGDNVPMLQILDSSGNVRREFEYERLLSEFLKFSNSVQRSDKAGLSARVYENIADQRRTLRTSLDALNRLYFSGIMHESGRRRKRTVDGPTRIHDPRVYDEPEHFKHTFWSYAEQKRMHETLLSIEMFLYD